MKKTYLLCLSLILASSLSACGSSGATAASATDASPAETAADTAASSTAPSAPSSAGDTAPETPEAWKPTQNIEVAVSAKAGGGADLWARAVTNAITSNQLSDVSWVVNNYPGGGSAVGYNYVMNQSGNDHCLLSLAISGCISSYMSEWDTTWEEMIQPCFMLAMDDVTLCTRADSPYQTIEDLLEAARTNPGTIRFGSDQRNNSSQYGFEMLKEYAGADMNYVQFDSSGDAATALLGGHVDCAILNPSECIGQVESGDFIPVVTFATERLGGVFADTPTFADIGYPQITFREFRGMAAPIGTPSEVMEYYAEIGRQLMDTPEMKDYFEKNYLTPCYMGTEEANAYVKTTIDNIVGLFRSLPNS